ncbi:hypothetical protein HNO51_08270 [Billgrantia sulfidoxydans]|uniref:Uncharacterized protein n=1 Tax=Billgrantia sulfidoxydans TaxID=2733484 RepID=A0ABX7W2V9_9GAMM|nr:hypothetical protein [Halomonas sulfidoxydans]QTP54679.1 hypothetical protein HNO51_08270 [Halomonas sulfidoxydans]
MAQDALHQALSAFRHQQRIEDMNDLRDRFYALAAAGGDGEQKDLLEEAIDFVKEAGVDAPGYQVACLLLGTGEHHFHHGEPNLAHVFQGDMPTLAEMIDQEARTTHAAHLKHDPASTPPLPAYLRHQRQQFTIDASELRDGEWRHYEFTSLRNLILGELEQRVAGTQAELLPFTTHRVDLGEGWVERQHVPASSADNLVRRDLVLFNKRLAHSLTDYAMTVLQRDNALPAAIGITREPDTGPGHPEPLYTVALVNPGDASALNCGDIIDCMNWLGTFELAPVLEDVMAWGEAQLDRVLPAEIERLQGHYAAVQGPPEPYRQMMDDQLDRLLEGIREQVDQPLR